MSVIWSGITEGGAIVPVQVDDSGKVIATASPSGDYVKKTGDTMTGPLVLPGNPTQNLQAATKQYVDASSGGGSGLLAYGAFNSAGDPQGGFNFAFCRRTSKGKYSIGFDTPMFYPNYIVAVTPKSVDTCFRITNLVNVSFEIWTTQGSTNSTADRAMQFAVLATFPENAGFKADPV